MRMRPLSPLLAGFFGLALMSLSGCGSDLKPVSQSVNNLSYDPSGQYSQANNAQVSPGQTPVVAQIAPATASSASSVNAVTIAPPSAVPATAATAVSPAPTAVSSVPAQPAQTPQQLVASMDQQATQVPTKNNFFNASMTYDFTPGAVYTIYCAPLNLTDIALEPQEKIISIAAGDSLRWQVSQTYSGAGMTLAQHIIVKPNSPNLTNSLFITTDRRVYHLTLQSVTGDSYMVEVNWHYETSPLTFVSNQDQGYSSSGSASGMPTASPFQLDLSKLDFNYKFGTVKGSQPTWYPTRIFNDGRQTFIEFPADFYNSDLPVLYIATTDKSYGTMVNWRLKGRYMVIDAVILKARLESGVVSKDDQTVIQIEHS